MIRRLIIHDMFVLFLSLYTMMRWAIILWKSLELVIFEKTFRIWMDGSIFCSVYSSTQPATQDEVIYDIFQILLLALHSIRNSHYESFSRVIVQLSERFSKEKLSDNSTPWICVTNKSPFIMTTAWSKSNKSILSIIIQFLLLFRSNPISHVGMVVWKRKPREQIPQS